MAAGKRATSIIRIPELKSNCAALVVELAAEISDLRNWVTEQAHLVVFEQIP